jgi:hypothetical protein
LLYIANIIWFFEGKGKKITCLNAKTQRLGGKEKKRKEISQKNTKEEKKRS